MKFDKEIIDIVKAENPGKRIFSGKIHYQTGPEKWDDEEFIYKEPTMADAEAMQAMYEDNPIEAQNNLLRSVIVHPDSKGVMDRLSPYYIATNQFFKDAINPFFGGTPTVETQEL